MNSLEALDDALEIIRRRHLSRADPADQPAAISTLDAARNQILARNESGEL